MARGFSPLLEQLIASFQCLPGVGRKSAQRMAFHLLDTDREAARGLADTLSAAVERIRHCGRCRMLSEHELCDLCRDQRRDDTVICVVESAADVLAIEESQSYRGRYFVLLGHLSPIDGIGPTELGLEVFERRLASEPISEAILATNVTVEGDATAHLLAEIAARHDVKASRIAHGVPMGGELEYLDSGTLARALSGRRQIALHQQ
jgi:recombination protein RecR